MKKINLLVFLAVCVGLISFSTNSYSATLSYPFCFNGNTYYANGYVTRYNSPNGTSEQAVVMEEAFSIDVRSEVDYYFTSRKPNAIMLGHSTTTYNCHGYAWSMRERDKKYWIDSGRISINWNDGSFVSTNESNAERVVYIKNGGYEHSAAKCYTVSGMYESKWGYGPYMRHALGYDPYNDCTSYAYYKHASPSFKTASSMIGGSENKLYKVAYIPADEYVVWSYPSNLLSEVSSTDSTIVIKPKNSTITGDATLLANYYYNSGNFKCSASYYIGVGGPHSRNVSLVVRRSSDGVEVYPSGCGLAPNSYYYAYLSSSASLTNVIWGVDSHLQNLYSDNNSMYFKTDSQGWGMLNIYGTVSSYGQSKKLLGVTLYGGGI